MSSKQDNNKTRILYSILNEMGKYHRDKSTIIDEAIKNRLNESFKNYYDSVIKSYEKLEYKEELRLLKKLNKM